MSTATRCGQWGMQHFEMGRGELSLPLPGSGEGPRGLAAKHFLDYFYLENRQISRHTTHTDRLERLASIIAVNYEKNGNSKKRDLLCLVYGIGPTDT